eukprot:scaffold43948_cov67-Phaeocystis_antarctica.AAC.6
MLCMLVTRVPAHRARQLPRHPEREALAVAVERRVARGTHESRLVDVGRVGAHSGCWRSRRPVRGRLRGSARQARALPSRSRSRVWCGSRPPGRATLHGASPGDGARCEVRGVGVGVGVRCEV